MATTRPVDVVTWAVTRAGRDSVNAAVTRRDAFAPRLLTRSAPRVRSTTMMRFCDVAGEPSAGVSVAVTLYGPSGMPRARGSMVMGVYAASPVRSSTDAENPPPRLATVTLVVPGTGDCAPRVMVSATPSPFGVTRLSGGIESCAPA